MNHIIHFLLLQLDPKEKVKFSNTLLQSDGLKSRKPCKLFGFLSKISSLSQIKIGPFSGSLQYRQITSNIYNFCIWHAENDHIMQIKVGEIKFKWFWIFNVNSIDSWKICLPNAIVWCLSKEIVKCSSQALVDLWIASVTRDQVPTWN